MELLLKAGEGAGNLKIILDFLFLQSYCFKQS